MQRVCVWSAVLAALTLVVVGLWGLQAVAAEPASVFLEDYTSAELTARLADPNLVVLIFSAGTEETGPHVAVGKHNFRVRAYSERVARAYGPALVAPILPFAPNTEAMQAFAGTISLTPQTFAEVNEEVARSLIRTGFKKIALLSDHGGGQAALAEVAQKLNAEFAGQGVRVAYISDGYAKARTQIEAELKAAGKVPGGHGGMWDTAETMAVRPQAVRPDRFRAGTLENDGNGPIDAQGMSGDPRGATAELGRRFGELRVELAADELRRAFAP